MNVHRTTDESHVDAGTLLHDRFRLLHPVGPPTSTRVWRAVDDHTGAACALKICEPTGALRRARREAGLHESLEHPHVLKSLARGEHEGCPFFVTPWIEGGSLADRIRERGVIEPTELLALLKGTFDALECIHRHGVVHRDIKPSNLLIGPDGCLVADFGVASRPDSLDTLTGTTLGTLQYTAPEQLVDARTAGPESDVYALAATVFHALTGEMPIGLHATRSGAHRFAKLPAFAKAIWRATRMDRAVRTPSVRAFRADLESATAPPPSARASKTEPLKLVLIGSPGVGKSSVIDRLVSQRFQTHYEVTIGARLEPCKLGDQSVVLWEIEGTTSWTPALLGLLRNASGLAVVVDGTRARTAVSASRLVEKARIHLGALPYVVLLNKSDLSPRWSLPRAAVRDLVEHAHGVFQTSAAAGTGIEEAFGTLVAGVNA